MGERLLQVTEPSPGYAAEGNAPVLVASEITVAFGGVRACDRISLEVRSNEIVGLVGPNGSGKTTFLNAVCGLVSAKGEAAVLGTPLKLNSPEHLHKHGMARCFQTPATVDQLTALENVMLCAPPNRKAWEHVMPFRRLRLARLEAERIECSLSALERLGLRPLAATLGVNLTYGQRRMIEVARALVSAPMLLMLDEPAAGLNNAETRQVSALLRQFRDEGHSVLVVDHKLDFLNDCCDRIVALQLGRVIASGPPSAVWQTPAVIESYLGRKRE